MFTPSPDLAAEVETFRERAWPVIMDPNGVHHVFVKKRDGSEIHGQKRDWDKIKEGTDLFDSWINLEARFIRELYEGRMPSVVLGIANGANRLAVQTAQRLGNGISGLETQKLKGNQIVLSTVAGAALRYLKPEFVLIVEDESTSGSSSVQAAEHVIALGVERVEVLTTGQRSETLRFLDEAEVAYGAIILDPRPNFEKTDCETLPEGLCNQGWDLVPYGE